MEVKEKYINPIAYYSQHDYYTDPGQLVHHFEDLPTDIKGLCQLIQGFLLHVFWAERYSVSLTEVQKTGASIRRVYNMLAAWEKIEANLINVARAP